MKRAGTLRSVDSINTALFNVDAASLVALAGCEISTARRWLRTRRMPRPIVRLVALLRGGELGELYPAWRGWRVQSGRLVSPDGYTFAPGELVSRAFLNANLSQVERGLATLAEPPGLGAGRRSA